MKLLSFLLLISLAVSAGPSVAVGAVQEEMRWHGWAPGGQVVEINNVHGNVRAELATGDEIEVIALKRGDGEPEQVAIEVVEHKGGVTVCAVYPNAHADRPFDCRPSHGGGFREVTASDSEAHIRWDNGGGGDVLLNDLRVDFLVRLPRRMRFIGRTVDGEISAHLLEQDVEAHTMHGDVSVDMNAAPGGEVRAETGSGRVDSAFPLMVRSAEGHGITASGHVGRSHRFLKLKTRQGNIRLERAPRA
jgi:hypothetical protein